MSTINDCRYQAFPAMIVTARALSLTVPNRVGFNLVAVEAFSPSNTKINLNHASWLDSVRKNNSSSVFARTKEARYLDKRTLLMG